MRINLQNSPLPEGVSATPVRFDGNGVELQGTLYRGSSEKSVGIIVAGAWTTVKEQMAGTYARALAAEGYTALAFDFAGWGASGGTPRYVEDPARKTGDIQAAAAYLAGVEGVEAGLIGLGICASAGYMAAAVADDDHFAKLALVAPWLHTPTLAEAVYGGADVAETLRSASKEPVILTAASTGDETAPMFGAPYYTEPDRGLIPEYDNKFSTATWTPWLGYDAMASAERLAKPVLMVGSPSIALPAGVETYEARMTAPLTKVWLGEDATQFDFYDRADALSAAVDAITDHIAA